MDWLWRYLPTVQGRIVAGLGLVAAVVFGLWPDHARPFDVARAAAITTAAIAWLFSEIGAAGPPREHDIKLFEQISAIINDDQLTFLRDHDFHHNLRSRSTEPVHQIAEWHGPRYEFVDRHVQRKWMRIRAQIQQLSELYGNNLITTERVDRLTALLQGVPRHQQPPQVHDEIAQLNRAATALYTSYYHFDRFARRRLGL